ncbi:hypothetical protein AAEO56_04425 [Flavobacterium sp. DGU11]|uniref:Lipoprotein n=1 Tax=Flavobacterium arundinis TaxID=3139143 RepID=A0ABU9HTL7_9FLAO
MKNISLSKLLLFFFALASCIWAIIDSDNLYFVAFAWIMLVANIANFICIIRKERGNSATL